MVISILPLLSINIYLIHVYIDVYYIYICIYNTCISNNIYITHIYNTCVYYVYITHVYIIIHTLHIYNTCVYYIYIIHVYLIIYTLHVYVTYIYNTCIYNNTYITYIHLYMCIGITFVAVVQFLSHVWLFATMWTVVHPAFLSSTSSLSLLKFMATELVMLSNHLILCCPPLLLPSTFPSIRVFSNESTLRIRWPKYWSFSFNISPSNEYSGLISFRMDWLELLPV